MRVLDVEKRAPFLLVLVDTYLYFPRAQVVCVACPSSFAVIVTVDRMRMPTYYIYIYIYIYNARSFFFRYPNSISAPRPPSSDCNISIFACDKSLPKYRNDAGAFRMNLINAVCGITVCFAL